MNVEAQRRDPRSLLSFYRRMLHARRASSALRAGAYRSLPAPRGVYVFERVAQAERLIVALNFTSTPRRVRIPAERGVLVLSTDDRREGIDIHDVVLGPDEGVILRANGPR